jgi:putative PIN family toxin of toxin-antitoxin system
MNRRVVLDTSVLVSAALRVGSKPHEAFLLALASYDICASVETLAELELVLGREKFAVYLGRGLRRDFVALVRRHAHVFVVDGADLGAVEPRWRDERDDKFLALARVAEAYVLVSSDEDLLIMNPWNGVVVVTPAQFLARGGEPKARG